VSFREFLGDLAGIFAEPSTPGDYQSGETGAQFGEAVLRQVIGSSKVTRRKEGGLMWRFPSATDLISAGESYSMTGDEGTGAMERLPSSSGGQVDPYFYGGEHHLYRRRRRINPLNPRAARRAIRRVVAVRKMLRSIDRHLPKVRVKPAHPFARRKR